METTTQLSVSDFMNLKRMLNSTTEDYSIAIENIKNLELEGIYILLLAKASGVSVRNEMLEQFKDIFIADPYASFVKTISRYWGGDMQVHDLSYENIYRCISNNFSNDVSLRLVFELQFTNELKSDILTAINYSFLDDINIKVKW